MTRGYVLDMGLDIAAAINREGIVVAVQGMSENETEVMAPVSEEELKRVLLSMGYRLREAATTEN